MWPTVKVWTERATWLRRWIGLLIVTPALFAIGVWQLTMGHTFLGVVAVVLAPLAFVQHWTGWGYYGFRRAWPKGRPPRWRRRDS